MRTRSRGGVLIPMGRIESSILLLRGQKVLLDATLAQLYGTRTKRVNQQANRNADRFPPDFRFRLTPREWDALRLQTATSKGRGGRRSPPFVFTEHGALMLAAVLNTPVAIRVSLEVTRAFVRLRRMLASHVELARRIVALESASSRHDEKLRQLYRILRRLLEDPSPPEGARGRERIGFKALPSNPASPERSRAPRRQRPGPDPTRSRDRR